MTWDSLQLRPRVLATGDWRHWMAAVIEVVAVAAAVASVQDPRLALKTLSFGRIYCILCQIVPMKFIFTICSFACSPRRKMPMKPSPFWPDTSFSCR